MSIRTLTIARLAWFAATFTSAAVASASDAHPNAGPTGSWRFIGSTQANHTADHDSIVVKGPYDNFRRIRFRVKNAPLHIFKLVVTYDNGEPDRLEVRDFIPQGAQSRVIDLHGGSRSIRRIDFWYETSGSSNDKAEVNLFGMK